MAKTKCPKCGAMMPYIPSVEAYTCLQCGFTHKFPGANWKGPNPREKV